MFLIIWQTSFTPSQFLADILESTVYLADCHIFHPLWVPKSICLHQLMIVCRPSLAFSTKRTPPKISQSIPKPSFVFAACFFRWVSDTGLVSDWFPQPVLPVVSWLPLDWPIILCRRFLVIDRNLIFLQTGSISDLEWIEVVKHRGTMSVLFLLFVLPFFFRGAYGTAEDLVIMFMTRFS